MKYTRFENLPVWKDAARLFVEVCELTEDRATRRKGDWADQLERAALSISNNIAEGFELGTTDQLIRFLYIAKGSAGECRSMLTVAMAVPGMTHLKSQISNLRSKSESIARQLGGWLHKLQNTDIKGVRHLTDAGRAELEAQQRRDKFLVELKRMTAEAQEARLGPRESVGPA